MILRVIRGRGGAAQVESLRSALRTSLGPGSGELAGPARYHLASRPSGDQHEVLVLAFWASAESANAADAREISPLALARRHLDDVDRETFEIDETILRRSDDEPAAIRIATGRFSKPGSDIEMLNLLRERALGLGEEMSEAYVGRRMVERAVDVTFVSAWREEPEDRRLEAPFWTDISLRYDDFAVAVYRVLPIA